MSDDLLYRLVVAGEDSEGFRDHSDVENYTFAPSLSYLISPDTSLDVTLELNQTELPVDRGLPIARTSDGTLQFLNVPKTFAFHESGDV